jgi:hypothetical protein
MLPNHLRKALTAIINNEGDDIRFALSYLHPSTASSYVSKLKARGLAYTYRSGRITEVWAHPKGRKV